MSTVLASNSSTSSAVAALLNSNSAPETLSTSTATSPSTGLGPATVVDLSDHAKAILDKAKSDQTVATRLAAQIQATKANTSATLKQPTNANGTNIFDVLYGQSKQNGQNSNTPQNQILSSQGVDILQKYGNIPSATTWAAEASTDNTGLIQSGLGDAAKWVNFSQELNSGQQVFITPGRVPSDDEQFQNDTNLTIANHIVDLRNNGQSDQAQLLYNAFNNGTLNIQNASDVSGLNFQTTTTHFADAGGGGTTLTSSLNPTGGVKTAVDNGLALVINGGDRGNFYITWPSPTSSS